MNLYRTTILSAILGLAVGAPAHAATSAHGTVSNIGFELIDLDPNDGIIPSVNFNVTGDYYWEDPMTRLIFTDERSGLDVDERKNATLLEPFHESAAHTPRPGAALHAQAGASGRLFDGLVLHAQASNAGGDARATGFASSGHIHFILSPNSALRITADLYATAERDPALIDGGSYADVRFQAFKVWEWGGYSPDLHVSATFNPDWSSTGQFESTRVDHLIDNRSGQSSIHMITFSASATAATLATSPVPEPATWGMLLGGMGVLAAARRRRAA